MATAVLLALQLLLCLGVPALIASFVPRRWRLWIFALWVFAPLLVALAVVASESASGQARAEVDKVIYALLLIGSFFALPWLMACGAGYGIGAALRRRKTAEPAEPEAPGTGPPTWPPAPEGPTLLPPSGWQAAHVGFDHDGFTLDGLPVWALPWREEKEAAPVMLAHPAHPQQLHEFTIYTIDDGTRAARFAAAELSNGVWGFYRWIVPADAASGTSADGSLRYEHDLGPFAHGHYDTVAPVARLHDARTGAELFDGSAWASSRIVPQANGTLLLALEHRERQTLYLIMPQAGTFHDLAVPAGPRALSELASAAAAARAECDDPANACITRRVAPDGLIVVELQAGEWSNTHWVRSPRLIETETGRMLLDLWGTDWDAAVSFPKAGAVRLSLRRYHFGGSAEVEIDVAAGRYNLAAASGSTAGGIPELRDALENVSREAARRAPFTPDVARPRPTLHNWGVALLILVAALALIALGSTFTLNQHDAVKPQLDRIPPMPGRER